MMKRQMSPVHVLSLILLFIFLAPVSAQVPVERSKDKVVIGGVPYYVHVVKKGETIFSISRAYGITTEQLTKYNPDAISGIREGGILRIPVKLVAEPRISPPTPVQSQGPRDDKKFVYHKLQPGETVYFLSKKYNIDEEEILKSNPGIDITKLPAGAEIAIPRREVTPEVQKVPGPPDTRFYYHRVVKGETLSSIARRYDITLRSLKRENRDIRFPQVGDYLKIPGLKPVQVKTELPVAADTVAKPVEDEVAAHKRTSETTPVTNLKGSVNMAVLLPFYLAENSRRQEIDSSQSVRGTKVYKVINRTDDWIYPRSKGFIEMYQGILLAADTLRSLGLDVTIHTFDIGGDTIELTKLINTGILNGMDLIIGPVHSRNLTMVAAFAAPQGIPVVSPVPLMNISVLQNNPTLFIANPSVEAAQRCIALKCRDYALDNILLIRDDTTGTAGSSSGLREMITKELESQIPASEIRVKDFIFYSRSVYGPDSINRLGKALDDKGKNLVIIDSEDTPVMSESISDIHSLSRKYGISVIGYPGMRYLENLDPKICFDLGLMIYTPYWIDYSRENIKQFLSDFRTKFHTEPEEMSYAWEGYDIAYYFLSGLALHGKEFITHPEIHNPELLQNNFDFQRESISCGFENQKLFLILYSKNYQLELLNDTGLIP